MSESQQTHSAAAQMLAANHAEDLDFDDVWRDVIAVCGAPCANRL